MADPSWVMASIYFDWQFDGGRDPFHAGIRFRSRMSTIISVSSVCRAPTADTLRTNELRRQRGEAWLWFSLIRHGHACAANGYINFVECRQRHRSPPLPWSHFYRIEHEFGERNICCLLLARFPNRLVSLALHFWPNEKLKEEILFSHRLPQQREYWATIRECSQKARKLRALVVDSFSAECPRRRDAGAMAAEKQIVESLANNGGNN